MYTMMLVEDEAPLLRSLRRAVERSPSNVDVVATESNAVSALDSIGRLKPDILMTDICMPVMTGLELIEQALLLQPQLIPVVISGFQEFQYAQKALQLGARDYLLKPLQDERLNEVMARVIGELNGRQDMLSPAPGQPGDVHADDDNARFMKEVAAFIREHYSDQVTIASLADRFSISHGHLTRLFKAHYNTTPVEYLIQTRMTEAKRLLQTRPDLKIKQIASLVGYEDQHYFTRLFTHLHEVKPSDFRAGRTASK